MISAETVERIRECGEAHLADSHHDRLTAALVETYGGERRRNDCGYVFSVGADDVASFDCSKCGHDNHSSFGSTCTGKSSDCRSPPDETVRAPRCQFVTR